MRAAHTYTHTSFDGINVTQIMEVHAAVGAALSRSHLFEGTGSLNPFVYPAEIAALAKAREIYGSESAVTVPTYPRLRIGDDFTGAVHNVDRAQLQNLNAGSGGVPDSVVREAWARASPWMRVPVPDWWAFKVRVAHYLEYHCLRLVFDRVNGRFVRCPSS
jgi:hypothetical protein